jgi:hypothetical protein
MTEIVTPNTEEWIVGATPTPAFIQYLQAMATELNIPEAEAAGLTTEQIEFLQTLSLAAVTASGEVEEPTDAYLDTDGANRSNWITTFGLLNAGTATNAQMQDGGAYSMGRIQSIYNRQKLIIERQNEIVAALVAAGLMEQA